MRAKEILAGETERLFLLDGWYAKVICRFDDLSGVDKTFARKEILSDPPIINELKFSLHFMPRYRKIDWPRFVDANPSGDDVLYLFIHCEGLRQKTGSLLSEMGISDISINDLTLHRRLLKTGYYLGEEEE